MPRSLLDTHEESKKMTDVRYFRLSPTLLTALVASVALSAGCSNLADDGQTSSASSALLSGTATASSANGTNTADKGDDNNTGTRWESTQGVDPQWITIDLGSAQSIGEVK